MGRTCPFCNSSEIEEDSGRGDAICTSCGTVLEESTIVSDVQFQERGGGHEVVGQFVSRDRSQPNTLSGVTGLVRNESREVTYTKGKKRIQEIANQLRINQHCIDLAFGFFKMCVTKNLTRGRLRSQVVVACLYMACRSENTSHLLLDFSDVTQLPPTDPCMYILRFAALLDFGDKQKDIVLLATRIVQRMKKDWMSTGRRPTGLCGAALLLAARALNVNRTVNDIVQLVHISSSVIRKRLDEFANTPSGSLTIDEFSSVDLEENEDPPAFQDSKKKVIESQKLKDDEKVEEAIKEFEPLRKEIGVALMKKMKNSAYAKMISTLSDDEVPELSEADALIREEIIDNVYEFAEDMEHLSPCSSGSSERFAAIYGPSPASLGIVPTTATEQPDNNPIPATTAVEERHEEKNKDEGELDLSGIDDEEIDAYILTDVETSLKSKYWMARHSEHLKMMEQKRKMREEVEQEKSKGVAPKKKRKIVRKKEAMNANNHNDAIFQVIQEKNLSKKINYDILKQMEDPGDAKRSCAE